MTVLSMMTSYIDAQTLADLIQGTDPYKKAIIVDCRSFIDYNILHVKDAVNAFYSKMMRRRVYDNKVCNSVMLSQIGEEKCTDSTVVDLVLYSESDDSAANKPSNFSYSTLLRMKRKCCNGMMDDSPQKLLRTLQEKFQSSNRFHKVLVLRDGFDDFHNRFPELCESSTERRENVEKNTPSPLMESHIRTSVSHPCLSTTNDGPTQILPFLYLGSQQDAMDSGVLSKYGINYVINLSVNCPQPDALKQEGHFMRIPVNDTYQEKLLPHFEDAFKFLDEVCERGSVALVHCLAGISRSPTLAIAYIMRRNKWTSEQAYRYVKQRRPSISPNFNFMGQLLEYEARLREQHGHFLASTTSESSDNSATSAASFTLSCDNCGGGGGSSSSAESSDGAKSAVIVSTRCESSSSKLGKSISCETISPRVGAFRSLGFWESDCSEPSSKTNVNGKRVMETATSPLSLDRPRILDGLKSRKALSIPQKVDEDLPSPSTELQKLSFEHYSPDIVVPHSNSASNPFFKNDNSSSNAVVEKSSLSSSSSLLYATTTTTTAIPSTSGNCEQQQYSAENPTFDSAGDRHRRHSPIALSLPCNIVDRSSNNNSSSSNNNNNSSNSCRHRRTTTTTTTTNKFLTRLSHCLRKGAGSLSLSSCPVAMEQQSSTAASIVATEISTAPRHSLVAGSSSSSMVVTSCIFSSSSCSRSQQHQLLPADAAATVTSAVVVRSQSVSDLDKTQKRRTPAVTSRASFACASGRRRTEQQQQQQQQQQQHQELSNFIASSTVGDSSNATTSAVAPATSETFHETDRDSISSASSLEILVQ